MLFEVNTGAIARGYRTSPYPSVNLLRKIRDIGAPITLSSDCHNKDHLDCNFKETKAILHDIGFREIVVLCNHKFTKVPLKL
jgi:histidinol-phosphatase (PHP family)